jgi:hypothetical protein
MGVPLRPCNGRPGDVVPVGRQDPGVRRRSSCASRWSSSAVLATSAGPCSDAESRRHRAAVPSQHPQRTRHRDAGMSRERRLRALD